MFLRSSNRLPTAPILILTLAVLASLLSATAVLSQGGEGDPGRYIVRGVTDKYQRSEIAGTGAAIDAMGDDWIEISATPEEVAAITALGYQVEPLPPPPGVQDFPAEDSGYHDYDEMVAVIDQAAADHPTIVNKFSMGQSDEGRDLWAVKISDNPAADEPEPEVFFDFHQHGNEHLAVEQGLYLLGLLTDEYDTTPHIKSLVNSREIYIVFDVNPDGGEFDHATGSYVGWRKNRQPNSGTSAVGTDPNRNWGYRWGESGGSSGIPSSTTYRGPFPFSAPETAAIRDFVESREIGGEQQITAQIDFHTYGEMILWPYGYTYTDVPSDMTQDDHDVFVAMGQGMAALNGYEAMQGSDFYITDGTIKDWMYGVHGIFSFLFELYPDTSDPDGFYPPDEIIPAETARNREALLYFLDLADCPYRATGEDGQYCPNSPPDEPGGPSPSHNASNQSVDVNLSWTGGDPDGDDVIYDVALEAYDSTPDTLAAEGHSTASLDPGTLRCDADYYWQITAKDVHWAETSGNVWHFTTESCAPMGDPSNLEGTGVSETQIDLTWWDNSSAETDFRVERSPNGSTGWTEIASLGADVESYQDSGLSCGDSYYYRVRGYRSGGGGSYTGYSNVAQAATQPCAPSGLGAWATSYQEIDMSWQDNSSDETAFHLERSPNGSTGWTQVAALPADTTNYQNSGLSCSAGYYYRVRAYRADDGAYSSYSGLAAATTHPCPPSDLGASAASYAQINLAWQDNSPDEADFRVERSADGSTGWAVIATVGANVTSYQDGGLSCSTGFYYRVCARASGGYFSGYSNVVNGITHTCPPSDLTATASDKTGIDLAWQDNSTDETAFVIERLDDRGGDWTQIASVGADVTSYQDNALACNGDYTYRVRAYRDSDGYYSDYTPLASASSQGCGVFLPLLMGTQ
jgi:hypothetical protein